MLTEKPRAAFTLTTSVHISPLHIHRMDLERVIKTVR